MARAAAPGKVVLSGAYAVLEGAPALVFAVDRYAIADTSALASFVGPEVRAALGDTPAPAVDVSQLRDEHGKIGLGSSAAVLVATLAALELERRGPTDDAALASIVFERALEAHARAQGGGSGVDVAAATYGGLFAFQRSSGQLRVSRLTLPPGTCVEVWASGVPASTAGLIQRVRGVEQQAPRVYRSLLSQQAEAARQAEAALVHADSERLLRALRQQREVLAELGAQASAAIVTPEVSELAQLAKEAAMLPAGAGGGDIAVYVGTAPSPPEFRARAAELRQRLLPVRIAERGVHALDQPPGGAANVL